MRGSDVGWGILDLFGGGGLLLSLFVLAWFIAMILLPFFVAAINNKVAKALEWQILVLKEIRNISLAVAPNTASPATAEASAQQPAGENPEAAAARQGLSVWPPSEADQLRAIIDSPTSSYSEREEAKRKLQKLVQSMVGLPT